MLSHMGEFLLLLFFLLRPSLEVANNARMVSPRPCSFPFFHCLTTVPTARDWNIYKNENERTVYMFGVKTILLQNESEREIELKKKAELNEKGK